jgi:dihydrofolate reductase
MRKVILQEWISLDGHVTDKNGKLDFFTNADKDLNKKSEYDQLKFMDGIDTILLGRNTYHLFIEFWPNATTDMSLIADKINETKKFVFSNSLRTASWGKWPQAEIISGKAVDSIEAMKHQEGKNMVMWGSISLAQSLMRRNLIDEYHLLICPTITGGGTSLFPKGENYQFNLVEIKRYDTGVIFSRYEIKR